jgi:hypothetical protein
MKKRIVAMILLLTISVAGCGTLDEKNITKATEKKEQKQLIWCLCIVSLPLWQILPFGTKLEI